MEISREDHRIFIEEQGQLPAEFTFPFVDKQVVDINHTFSDVSLRGQGIRGALMKEAAAVIRKKCWKCMAFSDTVSFYEQLLQQKGKEVTAQRWVEFSCGHTLAVLHAEYDAQCVQKEQDVDEHYNDAYVEDCIQTVNQGNDIMVQNYVCEDLQSEYTRLKNLQIGPLSPLYYVSISMPYWYFNITDPEGNVLEITGPYASGKESV